MDLQACAADGRDDQDRAEADPNAPRRAALTAARRAAARDAQVAAWRMQRCANFRGEVGLVMTPWGWEGGG